jgi:hypothetical protein
MPFQTYRGFAGSYPASYGAKNIEKLSPRIAARGPQTDLSGATWRPSVQAGGNSIAAGGRRPKQVGSNANREYPATRPGGRETLNS